MIITDKFSSTVTIQAASAKVWTALTVPERMIEWMGEPEMKIEILTDWQINGPIVIRGFHHTRFENKGIVLQYEKPSRLRYSHLSSVSRLADKPEHYTLLDFALTPIDQQTRLTLTLENFPTETIRKHLEFYWRATLITIKESIEAG